ncbi:DUF2726 domain-containing protein [uncultured Brachyspira sp.]|uniref:DUF2726 domain-containing protein n=1 Tax=uncultured Brachyspira sp. TaxID=221953 RepID=UPI002601D304|nr:DUF2726 domain-containing protein [uncultured Brachyspira sp.]
MALISIAIMIFIIFLLFSIFKIPNNNYRNYRRPFKRYYRKNKYYKKIKKDITEERLANMDSGNISIKKIMNIEETKIFFSILKIFKDYNVYKQVSFKAFLDAEEDTDVWKTFRDFYCDFLITYKNGDKINQPIAVIEYNGAGHFGNTEEMKEKIKNNDMVKEKLINKAGMQYFVIEENVIKENSKFIDDKKLEDYLHNIENSLKKE